MAGPVVVAGDGDVGQVRCAKGDRPGRAGDVPLGRRGAEDGGLSRAKAEVIRGDGNIEQVRTAKLEGEGTAVDEPLPRRWTEDGLLSMADSFIIGRDRDV